MRSQAQKEVQGSTFFQRQPSNGGWEGCSQSPLPLVGRCKGTFLVYSSPARYPVGHEKIKHVLNSSPFPIAFPLIPPSWITSQINYCTHAFISGPVFGGTPTKTVILPLAGPKKKKKSGFLQGFPSPPPHTHTHPCKVLGLRKCKSWEKSQGMGVEKNHGR